MPLPPADFRDDHFQCAPEDQQALGFLRGGEEVLLVGMTPEGILRFRLPRVTLGFVTHMGGELVNHRASLHAIIVEPDETRVVLVWQTALPCHRTLHRLDGTTVYEKVPL